MVHQLAISATRVSFHMNLRRFDNEMHDCLRLAKQQAHLFASSLREMLSRNCEEALDVDATRLSASRPFIFSSR